MENAIIINVEVVDRVCVSQLASIVEHLHILESHMHDIWMLLDFVFELGDRVCEFGVEEANVLLAVRVGEANVHLDVQSVDVRVGVYVGNDHPPVILDFFKLKLLHPAIAIQMCL